MFSAHGRNTLSPTACPAQSGALMMTDRFDDRLGVMHGAVRSGLGIELRSMWGYLSSKITKTVPVHGDSKVEFRNRQCPPLGCGSQTPAIVAKNR